MKKGGNGKKRPGTTPPKEKGKKLKVHKEDSGNETEQEDTDGEVVFTKLKVPWTRKQIRNLRNNMAEFKELKTRQDNCKFYVEEGNKSNTYGDESVMVYLQLHVYTK
jgi:hypothetical protein